MGVEGEGACVERYFTTEKCKRYVTQRGDKGTPERNLAVIEANTHAHTRTHTHAHTRTQTHTHRRTHPHAQAMHTNTHKRTQSHTHTHTHAHKHKHTSRFWCTSLCFSNLALRKLFVPSTPFVFDTCVADTQYFGTCIQCCTLLVGTAG